MRRSGCPERCRIRSTQLGVDFSSRNGSAVVLQNAPPGAIGEQNAKGAAVATMVKAAGGADAMLDQPQALKGPCFTSGPAPPSPSFSCYHAVPRKVPSALEDLTPGLIATQAP